MEETIALLAEDSAVMKYIESVAQESPNRTAFYRGMTFGIAQTKTFYERFQKSEADSAIEIMLNSIDEYHFKKEQT